jgi:hypothetical protein
MWRMIADVTKSLFPATMPQTTIPTGAILIEVVTAIGDALRDHCSRRGSEARAAVSTLFGDDVGWLQDPLQARRLDGCADDDPWLQATLNQFVAMLRSRPASCVSHNTLAVADEHGQLSHTLSHIQRALSMEQETAAINVRQAAVYKTLHGGIATEDHSDFIRQLLAGVRVYERLGCRISPDEIVSAYIAFAPDQEDMKHALAVIANTSAKTPAAAHARIHDIHRAIVARDAMHEGVARARAQSATASKSSASAATKKTAAASPDDAPAPALALVAAVPAAPAAAAGRAGGRGGARGGASPAARGGAHTHPRPPSRCLICGEAHRWWQCAELPPDIARKANDGSYAVEDAWRDGRLRNAPPALVARFYESLAPESYPAQTSQTRAQLPCPAAMPAIAMVRTEAERPDSQPGVWSASGGGHDFDAHTRSEFDDRIADFFRDRASF